MEKDTGEVTLKVAPPAETEDRNRNLVAEISKQVELVNIWDQESYGKAADLAKFIKVAASNAEKQRKELVEPFNTGVKRINTKFKAITEPLEKLLTEVKRKLLEYERLESERRRKAAEEERAKALADLPLDQEIEPALVAPAPAKSVAATGSFASASPSNRWVFEVTDLSKVDRAYLMLDERKVKNRIAEGLREAEGLRIFQEKSMNIR